MADYHDYHQVWDDWAYWDQVDLENEMDAQLDAQLDAKSTVGRGRRPRRVVTDRMNPFTAMGDDEFVDRFRLRKASMYDLIEEIRDQLPAANDLRGCPVPPYLQTLIAIRCMATGDHQRTLGDSHDVSQTTVSECLKTVSRAIASRSRHYILTPCGKDLNQTIQGFYGISEMPGVLGAIGCTHIAILRPSVKNSESFRCSKGYFSLNVQAVCGPDLLFHNVVARWPGSVHNNIIFENSRLCAELELATDIKPMYHLLGDAGYPLRRYLLTPVSSPSNVHETAYNTSHSQTRNTIERAFGVLKSRFGYLGMKVRTDLDTTKAMIVACMVLHNIAVQTGLVVPQDGEEGINTNHDDPANGVPVQGCGNEQGRLKRQQVIRDRF